MRLPRFVGIRLGSKSRDLKNALTKTSPDRSELFTLIPNRISPSIKTGMNLIWASRCGEVDVIGFTKGVIAKQ
jgi:hypothetical protein